MRPDMVPGAVLPDYPAPAALMRSIESRFTGNVERSFSRRAYRVRARKRHHRVRREFDENDETMVAIARDRADSPRADSAGNGTPTRWRRRPRGRLRRWPRGWLRWRPYERRRRARRRRWWWISWFGRRLARHGISQWWLPRLWERWRRQ